MIATDELRYTTVATLKVNRGTTYTINYKHRVNGAAATLVGATIFFTVKKAEWDNDLTDQNATIKKTVTTHTDAPNGLSSIALTPTDTFVTPAEYYYDIHVKNAAGEIYKTDEGRFTVDGSPTNRTA